MDLAAILRATIVIGSFIAAATGMMAVVGILQLLRGAGIDRRPPVSRRSIIARQRAVDARLRARYLRRAPARPIAIPTPADLPEPEAPVGTDDVAPRQPDPQPTVLIGSLADEPAG